MPQAVSLFPSSPPQSNTAGANQSSFDPNSTRFDDALKDAQQKDSSDAGASGAASAQGTEKPSKAPKEKAPKGSNGKSIDPKSAGKLKNVPVRTPAETTEEDAPPAPVATDAAEETPPTPAKVKVKIPPKADKATSAPPVNGNVSPPPALLLKKQTEEPPRDPDRKANDDLPDEVSASQTVAGDTQVSDPQHLDEVDIPTSTGEPTTTAAAKSAKAKPAPKVDQSSQANVGVQPNTATAPTGVLPANNAETLSSFSDDIADSAPIDPEPATTKAPVAQVAADRSFAQIFNLAQGPAPAPASSGATSAHTAVAPARLAPNAQFAEANLPSIVTNVHSTLLPNGGSMQIRLNPPELGAMDISVQMRNGTMTATFDTSNDQASRMLSHSLGQLKTALEAQGVTVGALHVQQSPRNSETGSNSNQEDGRNQGNANDASAQQQEQQRKDMLRRMWAKLSGEEDPLDLVA